MKTLIPFLILCLIATCNAELRTWTAVNGKEVEAEFVSNEEGVVKLKLKSGKVFEVPANKLSKVDNDFISSLAGTDEEAQFKFLPSISDADVERFAKVAMDYDSTDTTDYTGWTKIVNEGQLGELVQWKNGQPDGPSMIWYTNGQIAEWSLYKKGEVVQLQKYYKTGDKKMLNRWGIGFNVWHKNGEKAVTMRFRALQGTLEPLQQMEMNFWDEKGEEMNQEEGMEMMGEIESDS